MKLRAITLRNVRRFQNATAQITGISDGITTICAPNESGKSTFVDALHAIFFYPHGAQSQEVRSLQPYSKGPVEIAVDVEDAEGHPWRIEKRYLSSKAAIITDLGTGRIHAQSDEAEEWIRSLVGADIHGPTGLLWVRQGISGFGPIGSGAREKGEREKLRETRQGLMSSVAGQIDNVTGGQRMDQIMKACEADLDALATKTGAPKAGGEWSKIAKEVQDLEVAETRLAEQVSELAGALKERVDLKRTLSDLSYHAGSEERERDIRAAQMAIESAEQHEAKIATSRRDLRLIELETQVHRDRVASSDEASIRKSHLVQAARSAAETTTVREAEASDLLLTLSDLQDKHGKAKDALRDARADLAHAYAGLEAARHKRRREELEGLLEKIDGFEKDRKDATIILRDNLMTPDALSKIEAASRALVQARMAHDAKATVLRVSYSGAVRLTCSDGELPGETDISINRKISIDIPSIGSLHLSPSHSASLEDLDKMERDLDAELAALGVNAVEDARGLAQQRKEAELALNLARHSIAALAPEGVDAIRRELEDIPTSSSGDDPQEGAKSQDASIDLGEITTRVNELEAAEREAAALVEALRLEHALAVQAVAEARTEQRLSTEQSNAFQAIILSPEDLEREKHAAEQHQEAATKLSEAIADLIAAAPDKPSLEAELERLVSARDNALRERERKQARLHELSGIIRARAEDNAEARLAEVRGMMEKAKAREERYRLEVQALTELRDKLDAARKSARDAYFEPIKKEIAPLLSMLHPDASIEMDSETMLPKRILREGVSEEIDLLSGGAAEQVAVLTRLAFARLYAQSGRQVPVILDDALVYSDDDRIIRMFTALTRVSRNQQIIVFSCRTRAFADLGGQRCDIAMI